MQKVKIAFEVTEVGGKAINQDRHAFFIDNESSKTLIVVADGVGGSKSGEIAATIIVQTAKEIWNQRESFDDPKTLLETIINQSTKAIKEQTESGVKTASTIAAIAIWPNKITSAHAGDSRIYQFSQEQLIEHTNDHSLAYSKFLMGEISKQELATHPTQNQLLSCLDGSDASIEYTDWEVLDESKFVVCSDGFWEIFDDSALNKFCASKDQSMIFANRFEDMLEKYPKHDNTTAVIAILNPAPLTDSTIQNERSNDQLDKQTATTSDSNEQQAPSIKNQYLLMFAAVIVVLAMIWVFLDSDSESENIEKTSPPQAKVDATKKDKVNQPSPADQSVDENLPKVAPKQVNDDENKSDKESQTDITEGLDSVDGVNITIDPNGDVAKQIKDKLVSDGIVSEESEVILSEEMSDQYATIRDLKLKLNGIPIFGAVVKLIKTESGYQVVTGKLVNIKPPKDKPKNTFTSCININSNYGPSAKSELAKDKLFIDAKSGGYLWQNIAKMVQSNDEYKVLFYDSDCSVKLSEPLVISGVNE